MKKEIKKRKEIESDPSMASTLPNVLFLTLPKKKEE